MSDHQPDILIFLSDQHTARLMGCAGDAVVETPNMDALARGGTRFAAAQAACPLCVPSRCAFMTGRLPSATGVFSNANVMPSDVATIAHSCGAAGYETVLCGRMHFTGQDQRHGFMRRIMGDFTPCVGGRGTTKRADLGPYVNTPAGGWDKHYGGGDSPVLAYDRAVVAAALEELARPHDRPLLLVVGTYGPHHTFVAPEELYAKYHARIEAPLAAEDCDMVGWDRAAMQTERKGLSAEDVHDLRAAYYGMIEQTDRHVGTVRTAWDAMLARDGRRGVFTYTSDHGEQAGNRGLWGKMSFFEDAVGIPMIVAGAGVAAGATCDAPVSLIDLSATICDLAGGPELPAADGRSLVPALRGDALDQRAVISEMWSAGAPARMISSGDWRYWCRDGEDEVMLVDRRADPRELRNLAADRPEVCAELRAELERGWDPAAIRAEQQRRSPQQQLLDRWGANPATPEADRWVVPESSWVLPQREPTVGAT